LPFQLLKPEVLSYLLKQQYFYNYNLNIDIRNYKDVEHLK
jgi:hypothetical protein